MNLIIVVLIFLVLVLFIFLGFPVFMATLITAVIFVFFLDIPFSVVIIKLFGGIDSFSLMAIPFFILAGNIMLESKITEKIVDFSNAIVGGMKGGLGHANIVSSILFAGIQGSGAADASAIGSVLIPSMKKQGYDSDYAVAITASSSTIGPIIPPSIAMIMYAYYTELSVGKLFLGGLIPGVLVGIGLMIIHSIYYRVRGYQIPIQKFSLNYLLKTFLNSIGALIMPGIILFGIIFGVFTPTESGIAASIYGLIYGLFISKKLSVKKLPTILLSSAQTTAMVMVTLAAAGVLSNVLVRLDFQNTIIDLVVNKIGSPYLATISIMGILLLLGCVIDPSVLIAMFASSVLAAGSAIGFDPIHYGVLMVVTMQIGAITPPVGTFLFISCSIAEISLEQSVRVMIPFFLVILMVAFLILFFPQMSLWLNGIIF